jgi:hypothetical protein
VPDSAKESRQAYAAYLLEDAIARLRFQHEFSLAGFRTLILINGGAIIALLTYAGNVLSRGTAANLRGAFLAYVGGLVATTAAYIFAYFSQGLFMDATGLSAIGVLGISGEPEKQQTKIKKGTKRGNWCLLTAIVLTVLGLVGFVAGSAFAMAALT